MIRAEDLEHEDQAITRFLAILENDIEAGRNIGNLSDGMAFRMLSVLKLPVGDVAAKSRHPLEEGDSCLFNALKRMEFAPLPDMARLRGNDTWTLSRLYAVTSVDEEIHGDVEI